MVQVLGDKLTELGLEPELTRRGAIAVRPPGNPEGPARAMVAHADTIGAIVSEIKPNGRLKLTQIGTHSASLRRGTPDDGVHRPTGRSCTPARCCPSRPAGTAGPTRSTPRASAGSTSSCASTNGSSQRRGRPSAGDPRGRPRRVPCTADDHAERVHRLPPPGRQGGARRAARDARRARRAPRRRRCAPPRAHHRHRGGRASGPPTDSTATSPNWSRSTPRWSPPDRRRVRTPSPWPCRTPRGPSTTT